MKTLFVLLLLLPLCTADYTIKCMGEDFVFVTNQVLQCSSKVPQACYTTASGEKGCTTLNFCKTPGWKCCTENLCNV